MHAVALATGKGAHLLLLVSALEIEGAGVGTAVHFALAQIDHVIAAGDFLPHGFFGLKRIPALVDIAEGHALTDFHNAGVGLFLPREHAEQSGFTRTVWPDDTDNAARRQLE